MCFLIALVFAGVIPPAAPGQETFPQAEDREQWVEEQIKLLDADTLRERSAAERALLEAGPEVLPLLPPPELLPNAAVRQAVRRIRLRLEEAKARDSVKPSRITLQETASLENLLENITKQTGNRLQADALSQKQREQSVSLDVSQKPFWDVMEQLAGEAEFLLDGSADTAADRTALQLDPVDPESSMRPAAENVGAFRVEVDSLKLPPLFGVEDRQLLRVPFRLMAEPRLRPLFLKLAGEDFSAETGDTELAPFNPEAKLELPLGEGGMETSFYMDFEVPKPFPADTVEAEGKATLTVAAASEDITFTNLAKSTGASRRRGGVTVTLNEIDFREDKNNSDRRAARFRITVHYDTGGPAFESHRTWIFHNQVFLEDAKGRRFERNSDFHTALQTDGGVVVEYNFDDLPGQIGDYKFTYIAPTLIINVPIEFHFEDLTVPKPQ